MLIALEKSVTLYSKNYQTYWIAPVRIRLDSRLVYADADFIREKKTVRINKLITMRST